jgi:hypothetical protein
MTGYPFRNDATYEERADQLRNERKLRPAGREPTTYSALAGLDLSLEGRFAPGGYVVGSEPGVSYPGGAGPWASDPVGQEPSLGYSVNDLPPIGEAHEVARSTRETAASGMPSEAGNVPGVSISDRVGGAEAVVMAPRAVSAPSDAPAEISDHPHDLRRPLAAGTTGSAVGPPHLPAAVDPVSAAIPPIRRRRMS